MAWENFEQKVQQIKTRKKNEIAILLFSSEAKNLFLTFVAVFHTPQRNVNTFQSEMGRALSQPRYLKFTLFFDRPVCDCDGEEIGRGIENVFVDHLDQATI